MTETSILYKHTNLSLNHPIVSRTCLQIIEALNKTSFSEDQKKAITSFCVVDGLLYQETLWSIAERISEEYHRELNSFLAGTNKTFPTVTGLKRDAELFLYTSKNLMRDLVTEVLTTAYPEINGLDGSAFFNLKTGKSPIEVWAEKKHGPNHLVTQAFRTSSNYFTELVAKRNASEHPYGKAGKLFINQPFIQEENGVKTILDPTWHRTGQEPSSIIYDLYEYCHHFLRLLEEVTMFIVIQPHLLPGYTIYRIPGRQMAKKGGWKFVVTI